MNKTIKISLGIIIPVVIIMVIVISIIWYQRQIKAVDYKSTGETKIIEIAPGTGTVEIVDLLKENNLINSTLATKIYIKLNNIKGLQAGKYQLSTDMPLEAVLTTISSGEVFDERVNITFLEGKNIRWYAAKIAEQTNNTEEDVYNLLQDKNYIQSLIDKYWFLNSDIQNTDIYYPLEGYLYPDTYTFENADVSVKEIFNIILNHTDKVLSKYKAQIQNSQYSIHQILTIASIVEMEGKTAEDRSGIARVVYNRILKNMSIGSDVTTYYGIKVDMGERDLYAKEINTYNPYNTRGPNMNGKLPVGPISGVSEESLNATLNPSSSDYLYFVADAKGNIHFTKNYEEHQKIIDDLRKQGLWYEYDN
ncbi:MAG: endolytic transglycosylase MltG [Clostridia bacterium]|nr:endolytic transglycosylase MltG [Clostridia bacterium]